MTPMIDVPMYLCRSQKSILAEITGHIDLKLNEWVGVLEDKALKKQQQVERRKNKAAAKAKAAAEKSAKREAIAARRELGRELGRESGQSSKGLVGAKTKKAAAEDEPGGKVLQIEAATAKLCKSVTSFFLLFGLSFTHHRKVLCSNLFCDMFLTIRSGDTDVFNIWVWNTSDIPGDGVMLGSGSEEFRRLRAINQDKLQSLKAVSWLSHMAVG